MAKSNALGGFKVSDEVTKIASGRVRDDSYDAPVKFSYENGGKVLEYTVKNEAVEDVRKGLQRSALYLKLRIAGPEYKENTDGTTTVYFSAHDKMPRNGSRKVETGDAPSADVETATV